MTSESPPAGRPYTAEDFREPLEKINKLIADGVELSLDDIAALLGLPRCILLDALYEAAKREGGDIFVGIPRSGKDN